MGSGQSGRISGGAGAKYTACSKHLDKDDLDRTEWAVHMACVRGPVGAGAYPAAPELMRPLFFWCLARGTSGDALRHLRNMSTRRWTLMPGPQELASS